LFREFSDVLGSKFKIEEENIPEEINKLIEKREEARKKLDYKTADKIREKIKELGYLLEDAPEGPKVRKTS